MHATVGTTGFSIEGQLVDSVVAGWCSPNVTVTGGSADVDLG